MTQELQAIKKQIKENISALISKDNLDGALILLEQYTVLEQDDIEVYSIQAVIAIQKEELNEAEVFIQKGLKKDKNNFDLLYNLAYILELRQDYIEAGEIYLKLAGKEYDKRQQIYAKEGLLRIKEAIPELEVVRKKIAFFVKPGMDTFLENVIAGLEDQYDVRKVVVTDGQQIAEEMQWADICWFEWCDELIIYGSKLDIAKKKKIMCRLHSYEAFTDWPEQVEWKNVDNFIIDSEHIKKIVLSKINIAHEKISMIPVGINDENFTFKCRKKGFNVSFVGYINFKKGPMLLIQLLDALVKRDNRYKLHVCGQFQDYRYALYFEQMIKELKLENNFRYNGRVESVNDWLEDKDYIVSTSLLEGQHITVMEGMCKGIKPIIHNFVGAKQLYKDGYVWNTIDEAVDMIQAEQYFSSEYRSFIVDNYSNEQQLQKIKHILKGLKR